MKEKISNRSRQFDDIIKDQINLIREISSDMKSSIDDNNMDNVLDKKLKSIGKELENNLNKKSKIDSMILEFIVREE